MTLISCVNDVDGLNLSYLNFVLFVLNNNITGYTKSCLTKNNRIHFQLTI